MTNVYLYLMPEFANPADVKLRPTTLVPEPEVQPVVSSGGQRGRRRGAEYGLVVYPVRGRRELTLDLVQARQVLESELEAYWIPVAAGELRPVLEVLADFEQSPNQFHGQVRQVAGLVQPRARFSGRMRLAHRIMFGLLQAGQGFGATVFGRGQPLRETPAWIGDILESEAINREQDDEEAILLLIASRR